MFGVWKIKWLHLQEPGGAGQAAGWGECQRFLHGDSPSGGGRGTWSKGEDSAKYSNFD